MGKYYYFRDKQGYFKLAYTSEGKRVIDKQDTGKSSYEINLHLPDGTVFPALFPQTGFKALETDPQSMALMSRLWTGFFGTARCRYPEKFSKPGFQPKMA